MGILGISKRFLETAPCKCIIFTPSTPPPPLWEFPSRLGDNIPWNGIFLPLCLEFSSEKICVPSWNFQGPHPRVYGLKTHCAITSNAKKNPRRIAAGKRLIAIAKERKAMEQQKMERIQNKIWIFGVVCTIVSIIPPKKITM